MHNWSQKNNCKLWVTNTGWGKTLENELKVGDKSKLEPTIAFQTISRDFFEQLKIPYFDNTDSVNLQRSDNPKSYVIPLDCHPNEKGAKLIADIIWKNFLRERLSKFK